MVVQERVMKIPNNLTIWVILASATLTAMAGSIVAPALNLMREDLNVDPASAGLIVTAHGLFVALFSPLFGSLMDRTGAKKPFVFGLLLYSVAGGSGLIIQSYWLLLMSRVLLGIGIAAITNAITVIILNLYTDTERNKIMGWRGSASSFGGIIWPLIGGTLGSFSWHLPFSAYLVGIPLGVLALITIPEVEKEITLQEGRNSLIKVLKDNPLLFVIYGLTFLQSVLLYGVIVFLPQLLETIDISNPFYISLFITVMALSAGATSMMYGKIRKRLSYTLVVFCALALWTGGFAAVSFVFSSLIIAGSVILFGIGAGMVLPTVMVMVGDIGPLSFRGRISSYLGSSGFLGQFLSPIIFAPIISLIGLSGIFQVSAGVCAVLFLVVLMSMKK